MKLVELKERGSTVNKQLMSLKHTKITEIWDLCRGVNEFKKCYESCYYFSRRWKWWSNCRIPQYFEQIEVLTSISYWTYTALMMLADRNARNWAISTPTLIFQGGYHYWKAEKIWITRYWSNCGRTDPGRRREGGNTLSCEIYKRTNSVWNKEERPQQ
jgi:hypothetical protein